MPFVPTDGRESLPPRGRTDRSKWARFKFFVIFTTAYEALTWGCWVPLMRAEIEKLTTPKAEFWELRILLFTIELRVLLVLALFILCLPFVPAVRSVEATAVGALTAALTSAFDYWCWHFGFIELSGPLFGLALAAPAFSFGIAALLVRYIESRSSPHGVRR